MSNSHAAAFPALGAAAAPTRATGKATVPVRTGAPCRPVGRGGAG